MLPVTLALVYSTQGRKDAKTQRGQPIANARERSTQRRKDARTRGRKDGLPFAQARDRSTPRRAGEGRQEPLCAFASLRLCVKSFRPRRGNVRRLPVAQARGVQRQVARVKAGQKFFAPLRLGVFALNRSDRHEEGSVQRKGAKTRRRNEDGPSPMPGSVQRRDAKTRGREDARMGCPSPRPGIVQHHVARVKAGRSLFAPWRLCVKSVRPRRGNVRRLPVANARGRPTPRRERECRPEPLCASAPLRLCVKSSRPTRGNLRKLPVALAPGYLPRAALISSGGRRRRRTSRHPPFSRPRPGSRDRHRAA